MNMKLLATLFALPLLAACAPQVESTIYLADVQKVLADGKALETPALLRIPQGGEDDCNKGLAALIEKLKTLAPVTGKGQCISKDSDELAEIETAIQIVTPDSTYDAANLFALVVTPPGADGNVSLSLKVLKPIDEVVKALASDDSLSTDLDPTKFIVHINNDGADAVDLKPGEVFVDGAPHLAGGDPVNIARRGDVEIRFSDVAAAYTEKGNSYTFATLALK
jgi:hypothetical protein